MKSRQVVRALAHRNFRLFFAGQSVSLIGTWMQQLATAWLVFGLTRASGQSALWLGVVGFAGQVPTLFLAPVAGVLTDRCNRHRLLLLTQTLAMLQALVLAGLTLAGIVAVWQLILLSFLLGMVTAFDMTARQAFLVEMVTERADLGNAIALNSSMVNGARLVGPALAGLLLARTSAGVCFLLNGLSYLAVLAALLAMHVAPRPSPPREAVLTGLMAGFRYAFGFPPIRALLLLLATISMGGMAYTVLLPVLAGNVLHGEAGTLGLLTAAAGVGALTAGVWLAGRPSVLGLGRWIMGAPALLGASLLALSFATTLSTALPALAGCGFALMAHMAASNTVLQTIVDEDKRGRVMSLYTMAFLGTAPAGSLLAGWLASQLGIAVALRLAGLLCAAGAVVFGVRLPRLRVLIRPIYVRLGILPELTAPVPTAIDPPSPLAAHG